MHLKNDLLFQLNSVQYFYVFIIMPDSCFTVVTLLIKVTNLSPGRGPMAAVAMNTPCFLFRKLQIKPLI